MKRQSLYLILLLQLSWIASSGQSGITKDTSWCYGITEMKQIAKTAIDLNTCDTLLSNTKTKLSNREAMVKEQAVEISTQKNLINVKNQIIEVRDNTIKDKDHELKKLARKLLWAKIGWAATTIGIAALILLITIL